MNMVEILFKQNPTKFKMVATGRTFQEFVNYLEEQPNFKVMELMTPEQKHELYLLARGIKQ